MIPFYIPYTGRSAAEGRRVGFRPLRPSMELDPTLPVEGRDWLTPGIVEQRYERESRCT
jgi:hypothetical protein